MTNLLDEYYEFVAHHNYERHQIWQKWEQSFPLSTTTTTHKHRESQRDYMDRIAEEYIKGELIDNNPLRSLADFFAMKFDRQLALEALGEDYFA